MFESTGDYKKDRKMVIKYLQEDYGFNRQQAKIVEDYAYQELHSYWDDYLNCHYEIADMVLKVLKAEESKSEMVE